MSDTGTTEDELASRDREVDGSLIGDVRALLEDGQTLVEAELAYQSARVAYAWNRGKGVVLLLVMALFFAFFTLVSLVVGLLLALIPLLTAWGAMAAVTLALAALAAACFFMAVGRFRKARSRLMDEGSTP